MSVGARVMLTAEKLGEVGAACEQLERAAEAVEALYNAEPVTQPPSLRSVGLRKAANALDELQRQVQELWS